MQNAVVTNTTPQHTVERVDLWNLPLALPKSQKTVGANWARGGLKSVEPDLVQRVWQYDIARTNKNLIAEMC